MCAAVYYIHFSAPVRESPLSPRAFGSDNWGKVNSFEQVAAIEDIGIGPLFEDGMVYRAFEAVFRRGEPWHSTEWFKYNKKLIEAGRPLWNCTTTDALKERLNGEVRALYRSMQTHGFLDQRTIASRLGDQNSDLQIFGTNYHSSVGINHEIKIGIGEQGDLLFLDGRHRLAAAKLLKIDRIPVRVVFVHRRFLELRVRHVDPMAMDPEQVRQVVSLYLNELLERTLMIEYIDFDGYLAATKAASSGHWRNAAARWDYHKTATDFIRLSKPSAPNKVLEMGTMGVSLVKGSDTIDYAEKWNYPGFRPTFLHDARTFPWPFKDKHYDVFVALRVFHHLLPYQKECFLEAKRIAKNIILVVPEQYDVAELKATSAGISEAQLTDWNGGIPPTVSAKYPDWIGKIYYWNEEALAA